MSVGSVADGLPFSRVVRMTTRGREDGSGGEGGYETFVRGCSVGLNVLVRHEETCQE